MDPVTSFIVSTVIGGIVGNRADDLAVDSVRNIAARMAGKRRPVNHDLQRAVHEAFHSATLVTLREFIDARRKEEGWKRFFINEPTVSWGRTIITALKQEIRALKLRKVGAEAYLLTEVDPVRLLTPRGQQVTLDDTGRELTAAYLKFLDTRYPGLPGEFSSLMKQGWEDAETGNTIQWYGLVCAFFIEATKTNPRLRQVFSNALTTDFKLLRAETNAALAHIEAAGQSVVERFAAIEAFGEQISQDISGLRKLIHLEFDELKARVNIEENRRALLRQYGGREAKQKSIEKAARYRNEVLCERQNIIGEIDDFIGSNDRGKLLITAPAGFGKSALLSDWLEKREGEGLFFCTHFFSPSGRDPLGLYTNLLNQLYAYYGLSEQELPNEEGRLRDIITGLILNLGSREEEGLMIVIDGLDEAVGLIDPLLTELPEGVYIIVTYRAGNDDGLEAIAGWVENSQRIRLDYLEEKVCKEWLSRHPMIKGISEGEQSLVINELFTITEGYPLHLNLLFSDKQLWKGSMGGNLRRTPSSFSAYVKTEFMQLARQEDLREERSLQMLFAVLAVTNYPLEGADLEEITGISRWELSALPQSIARWLSIDTQLEESVYSFTHPLLSEEFRKVLGRDEQKAKELVLEYCSRWRICNSTFIYMYYPKALVESGQRKKLVELLLEGSEWQERKRAHFRDDALSIQDVELALSSGKKTEGNAYWREIILLQNYLLVLKTNFQGAKYTAGYAYCLAAFGDEKEAYILAKSEKTPCGRLLYLLINMVASVDANKPMEVLNGAVEQEIKLLEETSGILDLEDLEKLYRAIQLLNYKPFADNIYNRLIDLLRKEVGSESTDIRRTTITEKALNSDWRLTDRPYWIDLADKLVSRAFIIGMAKDFPGGLLRYGNYAERSTKFLKSHNWKISDGELVDQLLAATVTVSGYAEFAGYLDNKYNLDYDQQRLTFISRLLEYRHCVAWDEILHFFNNALIAIVSTLPADQWEPALVVLDKRKDRKVQIEQIRLLSEYLCAEGTTAKKKLKRLSGLLLEDYKRKGKENNLFIRLMNSKDWPKQQAPKLLKLILVLYPKYSDIQSQLRWVNNVMPILLKYDDGSVINDLLANIDERIEGLERTLYDIIYNVAKRFPIIASRIYAQYFKKFRLAADDEQTVQQVLSILAAGFHRLGLVDHTKLILEELEVQFDNSSNANHTYIQRRSLGGILASVGAEVPVPICADDLLPFTVSASLQNHDFAGAIKLLSESLEYIEAGQDRTFEVYLPVFEVISICLRYAYRNEKKGLDLEKLLVCVANILKVVGRDGTPLEWGWHLRNASYLYEWLVFFSQGTPEYTALVEAWREVDMINNLVPSLKVNHAIIAAYLSTGDELSALQLSKSLGWLRYDDYVGVRDELAIANDRNFAALNKFPLFDNSGGHTEKHPMLGYLDDLLKQPYRVAFSHYVYLILENYGEGDRSNVVDFLLELLSGTVRKAKSLRTLHSALLAAPLKVEHSSYQQITPVERSLPNGLKQRVSDFTNLLLGDRMLSRMRIDDARVYYFRSLAEANHSIIKEMVHTRVAFTYLLEEHYSQAEQEFKKVLTINPDSLSTIKALLPIYFHLGNYDEALTCLAGWLKSMPNDGITLTYWKFYFLLACGKHAEAAITIKDLYRFGEAAEGVSASWINAHTKYFDGILHYAEKKFDVARKRWESVTDFFVNGPGAEYPNISLLGLGILADPSLTLKEEVVIAINRISIRANVNYLSSILTVILAKGEIEMARNLIGELPEHYIFTDFLDKPIVDYSGLSHEWEIFECRTNSLVSMILKHDINSDYLGKGFIGQDHKNIPTAISLPEQYVLGVITGDLRTSDAKILSESVMVKISGNNVFGIPIYSYVKLPLRYFKDLRVAMIKGVDFRPADYGVIIAAGRGDAPMSLKAELRAKYNLIDVSQEMRNA
jgi:hypothetical protein